LVLVGVEVTTNPLRELSKSRGPDDEGNLIWTGFTIEFNLRKDLEREIHLPNRLSSPAEPNMDTWGSQWFKVALSMFLLLDVKKMVDM